MTLYILSYNNYFNRQLKKLETIADYLPFLNLKIESVSFNPNDGITASQVVNKYDKGNYLVCSEDGATVASRWFIIEANRTRQGQYMLQLKRDVLADNLEIVKEAPMFVEKAMLEDDDPMIVNDEGMQTNRVKIRETLLKDASQVPWIVGYVSKNLTSGADEPINVTPSEDLASLMTLEELAGKVGLTESVLANAIGIDGKESTPLHATYKSSFRFAVLDDIWNYSRNCKIWFDAEMDYDDLKYYHDVEFAGHPTFKMLDPQQFDALMANIATSFKANIATTKANIGKDTGYGYHWSSKQAELLESYNGKTINYLGGAYKLKIVNSGESKISSDATGYQSFDAFALSVNATACPSGTSLESGGYAVLDLFNYDYKVYLESVSDYSITTKLSTARRTMTKELYDMFYMPAGDIIATDGTDYLMSGELCKNIAQAIKTKCGAAVYDIQLLPYCPDQSLAPNGYIDLEGMTEHQDYDWISPADTSHKTTYAKHFNSADLEWTALNPKILGSPCYANIELNYPGYALAQDQPKIKNATSRQGYQFSISGVGEGNKWKVIVDGGTDLDLVELQQGDLDFDMVSTFNTVHSGVILWARSNSFQVNLDYQLGLEHGMKIDSNCCVYRLCSPNYQGSFEFNVAKNGGAVDGFKADCTYKPYSPYIRVHPNFAWLYGADFGDGRGLICGGDFSLPQISDAWANYQLSNKNYQNTFNREIQSLDFNNALAMRNQKVSAATGVIADTVKGLGSGKLLGGTIGAGLAGGAIAGASSLIGGIIDTNTLAKQQREQRQLSIDKFSYQLGNIQALPYTISKVGTFDINSKVFPFIEFYDCTERELEAFENKIRYESMTVMRIGTLEEFKKADMSYIKGSLIRLDISEDSNMVNDIYSELYKGVYY